MLLWVARIASYLGAVGVGVCLAVPALYAAVMMVVMFPVMFWYLIYEPLSVLGMLAAIGCVGCLLHCVREAVNCVAHDPRTAARLQLVAAGLILVPLAGCIALGVSFSGSPNPEFRHGEYRIVGGVGMLELLAGLLALAASRRPPAARL